MSAILSERVSVDDPNIITSRVKLLKTSASTRVVVPSLPVVNSISCGSTGGGNNLANTSAYDEYDDAAKKLLDWYPTVPHPLLISVLNNTKGDSEKAIILLNEILALSQQGDIEYHHNNNNNNNNNNNRNELLLNNDREDVSVQTELQIEENRKRWRSEALYGSNTGKIFDDGSTGCGNEMGDLYNKHENITEFELRRRHSNISYNIVSLIIEQANGNLVNADRSLNKLMEESLPSIQNDNTDPVGSNRSSILRHSIGVNLMSMNSNHEGDEKYNEIMNVLIEYEKEILQMNTPTSPDVSKCLARSVISQNDKLNMITAKLSEVDKQLIDSQEQREKLVMERDEVRNQCEQLLGVIQQLQVRVESSERGNTLFFNSFHGPPPGSCY